MKTTTKQETLFKRIILMSESDDKESLLSVVQRIEAGEVNAPPHQRNFIWNNTKYTNWVDTLLRVARGGHYIPLGTVVTYQIRSTGEYFINDGWQRLSATRRFLSNPDKFKLDGKSITKEEAADICRAFRIIVQHRIYDTQLAALVDFQRLQLGSSLSPFDYAKGNLLYCDPDVNWEPFLNDFHSFMRTKFDPFYPRAARRTKGTFGLNEDAFKRGNYAMFLRYLNHNPRTASGHVPVKGNALSQTAADRGVLVEQQLAKLFVSFGYTYILQEFHAFQGFVERFVDHLSGIYKLCAPAVSLNTAAVQFLLNVHLLLRNNAIQDIQAWEGFIRFFLIHLERSTMHLPQPDGSNKFIIVGVDNLSGFARIVKAFHYEPYYQLAQQLATPVTPSQKKSKKADRDK